MGFNTFFRVSSHAVIFNPDLTKVLLLKQVYGDKRWGLPGGAVEKGETVLDTVKRECQEELGVKIDVKYLSGMYYHSDFHAQVCLFRCTIPNDESITLSSEHSEYRWFPFEELGTIQKERIDHALNFTGDVHFAVYEGSPMKKEKEES
ncbi:NUDIX hydrolase [Salinibacillus xinjiangensis]|uniref:NUDIX domain-containing protein n=1 Tax=Salinibacillus xinjiangensis TaxID=1229268 RepID=A0A6G1X3I2_9BACI|nr:NUDIX domain-containing protein [Salinibacillus xinjiangensis]MRG85479.1 NUDIX domain-containing protein [Salinibacillus xinjiangensis]